MFSSRSNSLFENDSQGTTEQENLNTRKEPPAGLDWVTLLIALFGFGTALLALIEHIQAKAGAAGNLMCDVNELVSCSNVLTSEYGEFLGIPLGAFGMAFWGGVMGVSILPKFLGVSKRWLAIWRIIPAAMGAVVAIALAYISYFVIQSVCLICTTTQITCAVFFIWSLVLWMKSRNLELYAHPNAFMRLLSLVLTLGVPPIVAGFIAPSIFVDLIKTKKSATTKITAAPTPAASQTPFPAEWLKVNKSNYVGNGEDYRKGNDEAKVVLQVFTDPQCPACRIISRSIETALESVGTERVLYVVRTYPLDSTCNPNAGGMHPRACALSEAARCAGQQGKFWDMLHWAYDTLTLSQSDAAEATSDAGIRKQAAKLGINTQSFQQCIESKTEIKKIKDDLELGNKLGLTGTPLLILNGKKFHGNAVNTEELAAALRAALP